MTKNTVYSIGYQGVPIERFDAFVREMKATVLDVRFRPVSRNHVYNTKALSARFKDQYQHLGELGNRNYKGGEIDIVNLEQGVYNVRLALERGPVILLCVCANAATCHRTVVADAMRAAGFNVAEVKFTAGGITVSEKDMPLSGTDITLPTAPIAHGAIVITEPFLPL